MEKSIIKGWNLKDNAVKNWYYTKIKDKIGNIMEWNVEISEKKNILNKKIVLLQLQLK